LCGTCYGRPPGAHRHCLPCRLLHAAQQLAAGAVSGARHDWVNGNVVVGWAKRSVPTALVPTMDDVGTARSGAFAHPTLAQFFLDGTVKGPINLQIHSTVPFSQRSAALLFAARGAPSSLFRSPENEGGRAPTGAGAERRTRDPPRGRADLGFARDHRPMTS